MIWEILVWSSAYALHHSGGRWAVAVAGGLVYLLLGLNENRTTPSAVPTKQALWRAFKLARVLHGLIVVSALFIVHSTHMFLGGLWKEWLTAVMAGIVVLWWSSPRRHQPTV